MHPTTSDFIRRALEKAGMAHIPVVSINMGGIETNPGFKLDANLLTRAAYAVQSSAIFSCAVLYHTAPLRKRARLRQCAFIEKWIKKLHQSFLSHEKASELLHLPQKCAVK